MGGPGVGAPRGLSIEAATAASEAGRYEVFATLGRGGMADVFLAVSRGPQGFNKLVVLKKLRAHLTEDPAFREMFLDEARLAARLNHPNVVQSYEVGEGNGGYFIAMEYLDGQPLNRLLDELRSRGEKMEPALAARIIADACSGLGHAHELGDYDGTPLRIVHRDVSPHNIFLTYDGQVKLVDFGIAKASLSRAETEVGVLKGKVAYMAPEQALGGEIDARVDLFALGLVFWEMLAGRQLFNADNAANTLHRLMNEPMPRPTTVVPGLDAGLEAIVMKALAKNPDERYASAREMRDAIEAWLQTVKRAPRGEEVGALLAARFEASRAAAQHEIRKYMSSDPSASSRKNLMSLASIEQVERAGGNVVAALVDLGAGSGLVNRTSGSARATIPAPRGWTRRRIAIVTASFVFFLVILVVFVWRQRRMAGSDPVIASIGTATSSPTGVASASAPPLADTAVPIATTIATTPTASPSTSPTTSPPSRPTPSRGGGHGSHHAAPSPAPTTTAAPPAATASSAPGFLTLDTYPWTRVSENGRVLGTTPLVHVALPAGAHSLLLENPDLGIHQAYTATIVSGESLTRSLGLR